MSPGNLSLLSGPCLMKYCFRKHSPGLYFWYVPGKEITCRWLYQFIRSQFSASVLPCQDCLNWHEEPVLWLLLVWIASWSETDVGILTTGTGKILNLCVMGNYQIPMLQNKWVQEAVTETLGEGDVRTIVSSSKAALHAAIVYPWFSYFYS